MKASARRASLNMPLAEYTWRVVHAPGYMVIHCMWVVGSGKGKGYGSRLLEQVRGRGRALSDVWCGDGQQLPALTLAANGKASSSTMALRSWTGSAVI